MSDPDSLGERIYARLKQDVSRGILSVHLRLDFAELAERYEVSTTPVREAAMRLWGEGLLEPHPRGGLRPCPVSAADLVAKIELHAGLTALALRWSRATPPEPASSGEDNVERARLMFDALARSTGNPEVVRVLGSLDERLERFRRLDDDLLPDVGAELAAMADAAPFPAQFARLLRRYHKRRLRIAAQAALLAASQSESDE
ncbi:MAG: GntR family transcriptional regulator [Sphingomonas sp.]